MSDFECRSFGKWILCGEHAVLRGSPALVFPVLSKDFNLSYKNSANELHVDFEGGSGEEFRLLFWGLLDNAIEKLNRSRSDLTGHMKLSSELPLGGGMGASAAVCVAVSRWCAWKGWLTQDQIYEFSRQLENLFHGESSGVDIAVAMSGRGLKFVRGGEKTPLELQWKPRWYLSYSGVRGVTSECVSKVKALGLKNPELGRQLDNEMKKSVEIAEQALLTNKEEGFPLLAEAIEKAASCFMRWGLTEGELDRHIKLLRSEGAVAVKPTGSGGGGYVLSLWDKEPPQHLLKKLLEL